MIDREKVIKGLEICSEHGSWHGLDCEHNGAYRDCPYRGCETGCVVTIAKDALALLKEQEAKTVKGMLVVGGHLMGKCPKCYKVLNVQDHPVACGFCGQKVKWDGND